MFSSKEEGNVLICMEIAKRLLRETGEKESFTSFLIHFFGMMTLSTYYRLPFKALSFM